MPSLLSVDGECQVVLYSEIKRYRNDRYVRACVSFSSVLPIEFIAEENIEMPEAQTDTEIKDMLRCPVNTQLHQKAHETAF